VTYTPDGANRILSLGDPTKTNPYANNIAYTAAGSISLMTLGNGLVEGHGFEQ
jgi:hypothetical protein